MDCLADHEMFQILSGSTESADDLRARSPKSSESDLGEGGATPPAQPESKDESTTRIILETQESGQSEIISDASTGGSLTSRAPITEPSASIAVDLHTMSCTSNHFAAIRIKFERYSLCAL